MLTLKKRGIMHMIEEGYTSCQQQLLEEHPQGQAQINCD